MLILSRTVGERIVIGDGIVLVVESIRGQTVRVGIEAPQNVPVFRGEIWAERQQRAGEGGR